MIQHADPIVRLFRACDPSEPLEPTDSRYVRCDEVRGENLAEVFERSLRRADPLKPDVKLFAGHRGVGKTSELFRLKQYLERPQDAHNAKPPFKVILFDVSKALDVNDLDFPDLLAFTAAEVQRQLRDANIPGFSATTAWLQRIWDEIKGTLGGDIYLKEAKIDVPFGSLIPELKNRPNNRQKLREAIERQSTTLLGAVNDLLTTGNVSLREGCCEGLVLIVDGLDKLVRRSLDDGKSNTHDRLFLDRSEQLASLKAHTVYTVPISMIYAKRCAQLEETFGEHNVPVSILNLRGKDKSEPIPDTPGMRKMWEMLKARCGYSGVEIENVFDNATTGHYLIRMTGGHPRHLMMFMQAAMNVVDALPITRRAAEKAVSNYANSLLREVPDEFWPKLRAFERPLDDIPKDEIHQEMLFLLHVFEYMNGQPWYEVNPVLRTLPKFSGSH